MTPGVSRLQVGSLNARKWPFNCSKPLKPTLKSMKYRYMEMSYVPVEDGGRLKSPTPNIHDKPLGLASFSLDF